MTYSAHDLTIDQEADAAHKLEQTKAQLFDALREGFLQKFAYELNRHGLTITGMLTFNGKYAFDEESRVSDALDIGFEVFEDAVRGLIKFRD